MQNKKLVEKTIQIRNQTDAQDYDPGNKKKQAGHQEWRKIVQEAKVQNTMQSLRTRMGGAGREEEEKDEEEDEE